MRICLIGCGYVGSVTGVCLADLGHEIRIVDTDESKVALLNSGKTPIYEPDLERLLQENRQRISATADTRTAVLNSDITFICVGTPSNPDGSINLDYVLSASREVGNALCDTSGYHVVIVKSTVLPGTTTGLVKDILEQASGKKAFLDFGLASNPEFLREGSAVEDFLRPDRIVVGVSDPRSQQVLEELYADFTCPKLFSSIPVAEMIKYVSNAFLATKISFANEIGNICKKQGIDTEEVFRGVGMDHRINPAFFRSGIGFGGSCFPKDVRALIARAQELGVNPKILRNVAEVNEEQPLKFITLLEKHVPDPRGKKIGVLGLAFKPDTDDIRDSRAILVVEKLLQKGATVLAYDPMAMGNFKKIFPTINYASSARDVLAADAVLIATEWRDFEDLDYSGKIVIDGRRVEKARNGSVYEGVCW